MKILVTTHGDMAKGICSSYKMLAGANDKIESLVLSPNDTGQFKQALDNKLDNEKDEILILCGIKGGSPYNECYEKALEYPDRIKVVAGLNLPMLLEVGLSLSSKITLEEIARKAVKAGKEGVCVAEDTDDSNQNIEF